MQTFKASVISVHVGTDGHLAKEEQSSISVELDGIVGDRHRGYTRSCWAGDKQAKGTARRNERQWSAASLQELANMQEAMDLVEPLMAGTIGVNICFDGISELSRLPKGTLLKFPSGAELIVEEYNPPCIDAGTQLADKLATRSGERLDNTSFSKAGKLLRGLVGSVEVPGTINAGDVVEVTLYEHASWLARLT